MTAGCFRWYLALGLSLLSALSARQAIAQSENNYPAGFAITLQYETVGSKVNYAPNLPEGGFAKEDRRSRFTASGFVVSHKSRQNNSYYLSYKRRQLNSLRDAFTINEFSAGIAKRFELPASKRVALNLSLDAIVNHTSEIYKNSYTSYSDTLITEVRFSDPRDARLTFTANVAYAITSHLQIVAGVRGGLSKTDVRKVSGTAIRDNGCAYEFEATTQGGSLQQVEACDSLVSYEQHYPNNETLKDNLGVSVADDLTYRDYFFAPKLSLHWQRAAWTLGTGYEFRQYFRPSLDHRIRQAGGTPATRNHIAFANASIQFLKHWQIGAQVKYQRSAFLEDIPFLYNALTYERYNGKGVFRYQLSLTRHFK